MPFPSTRSLHMATAAILAAIFLLLIFGNYTESLLYNPLAEVLIIALLSGGIALMGLLCRLAFPHVRGLWIAILFLDVGLILGCVLIFDRINIPHDDRFYEDLAISALLSVPASVVLYALVKYGLLRTSTLQRFCRPAYLILHFALLTLFPVFLFYTPSEEDLDRQAECIYREQRVLSGSKDRLIRMNKTSPHPHIREYSYIHQDADHPHEQHEWSITISDKGALLR